MDVGNRVLWATVGAVLTAAGALLAAAGLGAFAVPAADTTLLPDELLRQWRE